MPLSKKPKKKYSALPTSAPVRDQAIGFLDKLYSQLMLGSRSSRTVGDGERRARKRLAEKRKANRAIPSVDTPTRQRMRRTAILRERQSLTKAKALVMQEKIMGGSARIRSLRDIEAVLG